MGCRTSKAYHSLCSQTLVSTCTSLTEASLQSFPTEVHFLASASSLLSAALVGSSFPSAALSAGGDASRLLAPEEPKTSHFLLHSTYQRILSVAIQLVWNEMF